LNTLEKNTSKPSSSCACNNEFSPRVTSETSPTNSTCISINDYNTTHDHTNLMNSTRQTSFQSTESIDWISNQNDRSFNLGKQFITKDKDAGLKKKVNTQKSFNFNSNFKRFKYYFMHFQAFVSGKFNKPSVLYRLKGSLKLFFFYCDRFQNLFCLRRSKMIVSLPLKLSIKTAIIGKS
jgi:outer membrane receptor for ferrienterochelin and colicin